MARHTIPDRRASSGSPGGEGWHRSLAAFPADSGDPYEGFEFVNPAQGGDNILMYGLGTRIRENGMLGQAGQGNHIDRVGYDGKTGQMELLEGIAEVVVDADALAVVTVSLRNFRPERPLHSLGRSPLFIAQS